MPLSVFYFSKVISPSLMRVKHFQYCRYHKSLIKLRRKGQTWKKEHRGGVKLLDRAVANV